MDKRQIRWAYLKHYMLTTRHKLWVIYFISIFCVRLIWRALRHDLSKYRKPEAMGFALNARTPRRFRYGTSDLSHETHPPELRRSLRHHWKYNRHHPEYYDQGVAGMELIDIVMMFYDWMASVKCDENGHIMQSIYHGEKRFGLPPELIKIFENSAGGMKIE